jgi:3-phosphoshikimate 1-carboxyvinyltransferase
MMTLHPAAGPLHGAVRVPGDKSICHRAVMFGGLSPGVTRIRGFSGGADNLSTISVLRALGAEVHVAGDEVEIRGGALRPSQEPLDCGNSGTTMRLMAGLLAGLGIPAQLIGDASLSARPMERVARPLRERGLLVTTQDGKPPVTLQPGGDFLEGELGLEVASAQVKSCLLLAALGRGAALTVREPHASRDHTENMLRAMGVPLVSSPHYRSLDGNEGPAWVRLPQHSQALAPIEMDVPGDISSAAFLLCASALVPGSVVDLPNVGVAPTRAGVLEALATAGIQVDLLNPRETGGERCADLRVRPGATHGIRVTPAMVPRLVDEVPVLAVLASRLPGDSLFQSVGELRVKECDRLAATLRLLAAAGCRAEVHGDDLHVFGDPSRSFTPFVFDPEHDHRMAAAAAVAALAADGPCHVNNVECLAVSYPDFLTDLLGLRT